MSWHVVSCDKDVQAAQLDVVHQFVPEPVASFDFKEPAHYYGVYQLGTGKRSNPRSVESGS